MRFNLSEILEKDYGVSNEDAMVFSKWLGQNTDLEVILARDMETMLFTSHEETKEKFVNQVIDMVTNMIAVPKNITNIVKSLGEVNVGYEQELKEEIERLNIRNSVLKSELDMIQSVFGKLNITPAEAIGIKEYMENKKAISDFLSICKSVNNRVGETIIYENEPTLDYLQKLGKIFTYERDGEKYYGRFNTVALRLFGNANLKDIAAAMRIGYLSDPIRFNCPVEQLSSKLIEITENRLAQLELMVEHKLDNDYIGNGENCEE